MLVSAHWVGQLIVFLRFYFCFLGGQVMFLGKSGIILDFKNKN